MSNPRFLFLDVSAKKQPGSTFVWLPEQLIEVSNEWGFVLDEAAKYDFSRLLVMGHPGKLAKLAMGQWDTHSSRSTSAVPWVSDLAKEALGGIFQEARTVEGIFALLEEDRPQELWLTN